MPLSVVLQSEWVCRTTAVIDLEDIFKPHRKYILVGLTGAFMPHDGLDNIFRIDI
jgi:hypothetical protein